MMYEGGHASDIRTSARTVHTRYVLRTDSDCIQYYERSERNTPNHCTSSFEPELQCQIHTHNERIFGKHCVKHPWRAGIGRNYLRGRPSHQ